MKLLWQGTQPYNISSFVDYPCLLYNLLEMDEIEKINVPSNDHYIIHASYYGVTSYLYNNKKYKLKATGYLPDNISEDLKNKKATIVITNNVDTVPLNQILTILSHFLAFGVPKKSLIYVDSNPYVERILAKHGYQGFYYNWVEELFEVTETHIQQVIKYINSSVDRDKKFLFFGGKPRPHRVTFLEKCVNLISNFEKNTFISIGSNHKIGKISLDLDDNWISKAFLASDLDKNTSSSNSDGPVTPWDSTYNKIYMEYHNNSYWYISPSTQYHYEPFRISINEKQYKPIVAMQPFIMLSEPKMLAFLKQSGYKTFGNWIDESYDDVLCDTTRMNKVIEEVRKLNSMSNTELSLMLKDMLPVLIHNAELYMDTFKKMPVKPSLMNNLKKFILTDD